MMYYRFLIFTAFILSLVSFSPAIAVFKQTTRNQDLSRQGKAKQVKVVNTPSSKDNAENYSFRSLLIQGQKQLSEKTKEMKTDTKTITETEVLFIKTDFRNRIFSDEGLN